jgi:hypothetical protein
LALAAAHLFKNEELSFSLYTFSTHLRLLSHNLGPKEVVGHLEKVRYDGGTNLAVLGPVFRERREGGSEFDYFLLYTDAVDNLGKGSRVPEGIDLNFGVPVHVLAPGIYFPDF